ncbi:hypothetical protein ACT4S5_01785 [Kocuria oceani]
MTIRITAGALTALSQQGLHALIHRARTLTPGILVTVDLTALAPVDDSAVRLLEQALEDPGRTGRGGAVRLVLPVAARPAPSGSADPAGAAGDHDDGPQQASLLGAGAGHEVAA